MSLTLIQLATDNFTRADANPISGSWATVGGAAAWQIKSNMAESTVIGINANLSISTAVVWPADQYSEVTVGVSGVVTDLGGPAVRFNPASKNGYILFYQGGSGPITIQTVITPGSGATIASSGTLNVSPGDVLRLVVIGNQLSAYQNGVEIIAPFTDNTFATGSPGLSSYIQTGTTGNIRFSLWSGGSASITPPPSPASIAPTSDEQGFTGNVTVTGTAFDSGGTSTLSFSGTGVTVNSYGTRNATTLTANITITSGAALTARDVVVTNADSQTGTLVAAFTVTSGAPSPASISPTSDEQGFTGNVTITGTNFSTGTLSFSGTGITVNSYSVQNATTIIANITIASNAALSARDVTITNVDTQTGTLSSAFSVTSSISISGNAGVAGAYVTLIGFNPAVVVSVTADGSGNYTFPSVNAGTYYVYPDLPVSVNGVVTSRYMFTDPGYQQVTVVSTNLTGINFSATLYTKPAIPAWTKHGQVITGLSTTGSFPGSQAGTVMYEGNPVILTGHPLVFKMWYYDGYDTCYAESLDGFSWTKYSGNPIISNMMWTVVFKHGSTYYLYASIGNGLQTAVSAYTSTDGVTFTLQNASAVVVGAGTAFDSRTVDQIIPIDVDNSGVWHAFYTAQSTVSSGYFTGLGYITSTDGIHWTKQTSYAVIPNASSAYATTVNGVHYVWFNYTNFQQGVGGMFPFANPTETYRMQSTDYIHWTNLTVSLPRSLPAEFPGQGANAEVSGPTIVTVNGITYMYYTDQAGISGPMRLMLATTPQTLASLVSGPEDVLNPTFPIAQYDMNIVENPLSDGGNFTTMPSPFGNMKVAADLVINAGSVNCAESVGALGGVFYSGTTWPANQWSEFIVATNSASGGVNFLVVRQAASADTDYSFNQVGPLGGPQTCSLYATVAGVAHQLVTFSVTAKSWDTFRLLVNGNVLYVFQNGTLIQQFTDTNNYISSGYPGFGTAPNGGSSQVIRWSGGSAQLATPIFYQTSGSVVIESSDFGLDGYTIYYTIDGTTPTTGSPVYSGPVSTAGVATLKALVTATGMTNSSIGIVTFPLPIPPPRALISLPFSKRTTASVAVFPCILIASHHGAQKFTSTAATIGALQLEYAQLSHAYRKLRHQDTANNRVDLYAAIALAETAVANLNVTISAMTATGDNAVLLQGMQIVVANALTSIQSVIFDE